MSEMGERREDSRDSIDYHREVSLDSDHSTLLGELPDGHDLHLGGPDEPVDQSLRIDFAKYRFVHPFFGRKGSHSIDAAPDFGEQVVHSIHLLRDCNFTDEAIDHQRRLTAGSRGTGITFCVTAIHGDHVHLICGLKTKGEHKRVIGRLFRYLGQPVKCKIYKKEAWSFSRFKRLWNYLETGPGRYV
jgi:hypothetical protein